VYIYILYISDVVYDRYTLDALISRATYAHTGNANTVVVAINNPSG
jgi:hypothetical protein